MNPLLPIDICKLYRDLPEFVELNLRYVNQRGNFGNYPINLAAQRGEVDFIEKLLDLGVDINSIGEQGYTPLHDAAEQNMVRVVEYLLNNGADPLRKNDSGLTPLEVSLACGSDDSANIISDFLRRKYHSR